MISSAQRVKNNACIRERYCSIKATFLFRFISFSLLRESSKYGKTSRNVFCDNKILKYCHILFFVSCGQISINRLFQENNWLKFRLQAIMASVQQNSLELWIFWLAIGSIFSIHFDVFNFFCLNFMPFKLSLKNEISGTDPGYKLQKFTIILFSYTETSGLEPVKWFSPQKCFPKWFLKDGLPFENLHLWDILHLEYFKIWYFLMPKTPKKEVFLVSQ